MFTELERYFSGKTALVTGASSGLGEEFARQLHAYGAHVILVARRVERLHNLAEALESKRSDSTSVVQADLEQESDLARVCAIITERAIGVLINNAGCGSFGAFDRIPPEVENRIVALNVAATTQLAQAGVSTFKAKGEGAMLLVSSLAGLQPLPFMSTYAASKAFNLAQGVGLHHELRDSNIRISTLCPGPTATEFGGVARFPGSWTNVKKDGVAPVVHSALVGLVRNYPLVFPCWRPKFYAACVALLPLRLRMLVLRLVMKSAMPGAQWS